MIITKTPFRMSFFGGGTDFPEFFKEYGGAVLSTSIDKYCYITVRHLPPFFDYRTELYYSKTERVSDVEKIEHPVIREAMKLLDMHELHVAYDADLPARSGLGTSSSFAVGLLSAFYALKGKYMGKQQLAQQAIYLERTLCNEAGGIQDQIAAAYGGLNRLDFWASEFSVSPIILPEERKALLNDHLMLYFTGFSRFSFGIQEKIKESLADKTKQLLEMKSYVDIAQGILTSKGDLKDFGRLMDATWRLKRSLQSTVSTDAIDEIYQKAMSAGALGGKLLGAGGGGFIVFFVEKERQDSVRRALDDLLEVPFRFESQGTQVLYYSPELYTVEQNKERKERKSNGGSC